MRFLQAALLLFLSMLLASPMLSAAVNDTEPPPSAPISEGVVFAMAMFANGSPLQNAPIIALARSPKGDTVYRLITGPKGRFILSLGKGKYELDSLLDYPSTPGIDFASTTAFELPSTENATFIFYSAGSISGTVLQDGALVSGARVRVSCPSNSFDYDRINGGTQVLSGEAGDFLFRALPSGTCQVSSSTDSLAGSSEVQVQPGQSSAVSIELKKKAPGTDILPIAAVAFVIVAALFSVVWLLQKKGKETPEETARAALAMPAEAHRQNAKPLHGPRAEPEPWGEFDASKVKAVLSTLSEREREIVRFLLKSGGRAKRSQLQHKLLIPKTSLLRNLRSLERKNIVKLTPFGRNLLAEIAESLFR